MKTIFFPDQTLNDGIYAATIGFFDGVHLGHQFLMARLRKEAAERGMRSMAITFESHPRQVVQGGWTPELLTGLHEKLRLLKATGIDCVVVLRFNRQMAAFSARDFMQLMYERLGVRLLLTGYDNRFGHDRTEGFDDYQRYGEEMGLQVVCGDPLVVEGANASSSRIRHLLKEGCVEEARRCLGRPYTLDGQVVHGQQIGRRIGFPTANMEPEEPYKIIPKNGVYAVTAQVGDSPAMRGIMNIGMRPTFHGEERTLETNIFDEMGDLYGNPIRIQFIAHLRDEQQFASGEALAEQIKRDKAEAEKRLTAYEREALC